MIISINIVKQAVFIMMMKSIFLIPLLSQMQADLPPQELEILNPEIENDYQKAFISVRDSLVRLGKLKLNDLMKDYQDFHSSCFGMEYTKTIASELKSKEKAIRDLEYFIQTELPIFSQNLYGYISEHTANASNESNLIVIEDVKKILWNYFELRFKSEIN